MAKDNVANPIANMLLTYLYLHNMKHEYLRNYKDDS